MSSAVLEINDYELSLTYIDVNKQEKKVIQIGYALLEGDDIIFDRNALEQHKLLPSNVYYHYWQRLGYEDIKHPHATVRHFADLAYLQIKSIIATLNQPISLVLVVPAYYSQEQLALLLGILQSCEIKVRAIVNNGLLTIGGKITDGENCFLDINLHSCEQYVLQANQQLSVINTTQFTHQGISALYAHLASWLNSLFISNCRFDACHHGETEQQLYLQVIELLSSTQTKNQISIASRSLTIEREALNHQLMHFFEPIFDSINTKKSVVLSQRLAALLPSDAISSCRISQLKIEELSELIKEHHNNSHTDSIKLISSFDLTSLGNGIKKSKQVHSRQLISHLLYDNNAYPISSSIYVSALNNMQLTAEPCSAIAKITADNHRVIITPLLNSELSLNGLPLAKTSQLHIGDILKNHQNDTVVKCIHVAKELN